MKMTEDSIRKVILLAECLFLSSFQPILADDKQDALNLDYYRTPEAASFKKYGEKSVNEYTGTADISVPLYTIKCKDIEIPLVLRYEASGIKVEQEASWVGLGWNLMVGGCINYVCAGAHDQYTQCAISDKTWTEYLTTMNTFSDGRQYFHYGTDNINNWMESVPHSFAFDPPHGENLSQDMQNYLMWGYGERDFYSVNVLGKSFKFFIDPATLKPYIIGEAGEDFKIEPYYNSAERTGIGHQPDVSEWTITDSNGYVYYFKNSDTISDKKELSYTICWYLTGIRTPMGEKAELSYTSHQEWGRKRMTESFRIPKNTVSTNDIGYSSQGYSEVLDDGYVRNSYVKEIRTKNHTVSFDTSDSKECSGRKLNEIKVRSNDGEVIKTINFSYSSFGHSYTGGNYAPADDAAAELRLKLDNVKEIASSDTLTTSFFYNSLDLPCKKSCSQDYWGYYNGKDNASTTDIKGINGHTMLPTPRNFMTKNYSVELENIKGADRSSNGDFTQAAMLNKVVYPTGGYTTYEYEQHCFAVDDYRQSQEYQKYISTSGINIYKSFCYSPYNEDSFIVTNIPQVFTLKNELAFSLYVWCNGDAVDGDTFNVIIAPIWTGTTPIVIPVRYNSSSDPIVILQDTLPAGDYQLLIGAPRYGHKGYAIGCRLKGNYTSTSFFNSYPNGPYTQVGGGLRIKKISNYDHDEKLISYTTYDYNNSGKLLNDIETIETFGYTYLQYEPNGFGPATVYSSHYISGWNVTTGQTRFPAFFASCNPGNVGYSQVTKRKYDANNNLEKSVVTTYINHRPESLTMMDYYKCFDNGKMLCQETCDTNGKAVMKVENKYCFHDSENDDQKDKWYSTNMVARDGLVIDPHILYLDENAYKSRFYIYKYPYILSRVDLSETTITEFCPDGKAIAKTKQYSYNTNHQVSQIDESTSLPNHTRPIKITYSVDSEDSINKQMVANAHRLNDVVENKIILVVNDQEKDNISIQKTNYTSHESNGTSYYLPCSFSKSVGAAALETRAEYSYDDSLNICSIAVDGIETVYIWSYKGQYPIAKIEGLTYAAVKAALDTTISTLLARAVPSSQDLSELRSTIKAMGGHITTYTYKPLIGITSETLPNDLTTRYEYDGFGRLVRVIDHDGSVVSANSYNYKK